MRGGPSRVHVHNLRMAVEAGIQIMIAGASLSDHGTDHIPELQSIGNTPWFAYIHRFGMRLPPTPTDTPTPARKVSVKWPIGQTLAISIEIWPCGLRTYMSGAGWFVS